MPEVKIKKEQIRNAILNRLNDTEFHSGETLAREFNLSRSAISNHIKALSLLGIEIFSVKGRGYKLPMALELLSKNRVSEGLGSEQSALIHVENVITSTNDALKDMMLREPSSPSGLICMAEMQTAGRGRRGRTWVSPFGSNLYFSMLWHFNDGYQAMSGLSLMVGVILNQTLMDMGIQGCQVKWPNDLYFDGQKLAGILIEVEGQVGGKASAIIGIGVNLRLPTEHPDIDQAYTDLYTIMNTSISRNELANRLSKNLWVALPKFAQEGLRPFIQDWEKFDLFLNKPVVLISGEQNITGICRGIDKSGALILEHEGGKLRPYYGGEISVRGI